MAGRACTPLTLLALATAAGALFAGEGVKPLTPFHLAALRAQEPQRALRIADHLASQKAQLGLGASDGFEAFSQFTDAFGKTHAHYQQTYRGVKVWGSHLIGHVDAAGSLEPTQATVQAGIQLEPAPMMEEGRLQELVAHQLPKGAKTWPLQVEQVVFPTQFQDGLKLVRDARGRLVLDARFSVATPQREEPWVWAYHVSATHSANRQLESTELILDARTGEVLKKWDGLVHQSAPTAAVGSGASQYNGAVTLNTALLADGTYTLRDTTRATRNWPLIRSYPYSQWTECSGVGIRTLYWDDFATTVSGMVPFSSTTNAWGDGQAYAGVLRTANSETAAVDAHYAIQATWDYYTKVLGRTGGIDGLGGSPISLVHFTTAEGGPWANASWNPSLFIMMYGDGSDTGALTSLDVAAHEMSHGVWSYTANLNGGEGGGLNEANSDIHATMVKFWMWGNGGTGNAVPDTTNTAPDGNNDPLHLWTIGSQIFNGGVPIRWLYKPSLDGLSYDGWFDGVSLDDVHYAMGPGNRAFYFLSQGASSDPAQDTHTAFLPGGMSGIGNDKAIKIWYHGMATKVTAPSSDYHTIRDVMIASATELYGAAEVAAVKNAFAAINVGAPDGGSEPVRVTLPVDPTMQSLFGSGRVIAAPALEAIPLPTPQVVHTTDPTATWALGGLSAAFPAGGALPDAHHFVAPVEAYGGTWPLKAVSKADPKQFAVDLVWAANMDCDGDTVTDACDLGALALSYGGVNIYPAANLYGGDAGTDDLNVALFLAGFNNAFKH